MAYVFLYLHFMAGIYSNVTVVCSTVLPNEENQQNGMDEAAVWLWDTLQLVPTAAVAQKTVL